LIMAQGAWETQLLLLLLLLLLRGSSTRRCRLLLPAAGLLLGVEGNCIGRCCNCLLVTADHVWRLLLPPTAVAAAFRAATTTAAPSHTALAAETAELLLLLLLLWQPDDRPCCSWWSVVYGGGVFVSHLSAASQPPPYVLHVFCSCLLHIIPLPSHAACPLPSLTCMKQVLPGRGAVRTRPTRRYTSTSTCSTTSA
jgi:hypothetical protein